MQLFLVAELGRLGEPNPKGSSRTIAGRPTSAYSLDRVGANCGERQCTVRRVYCGELMPPLICSGVGLKVYDHYHSAHDFSVCWPRRPPSIFLCWIAATIIFLLLDIPHGGAQRGRQPHALHSLVPRDAPKCGCVPIGQRCSSCRSCCGFREHLLLL